MAIKVGREKTRGQGAGAGRGMRDDRPPKAGKLRSEDGRPLRSDDGRPLRSDAGKGEGRKQRSEVGG